MSRQVILPENVKAMVRDIEAKIHRGELIQGHKIPSIREMMRTYKTSLGSTKRGLNLLCDRKILITRPGAGIFVNSIPSYTISHAQATIMVFLEWTIEQTGIYNLVFEGIRERAIQEKCSILFSYLGQDNFSQNEVKKLSGNVNGVIMLAEYDRGINTFSLDVPAIGVGWQLKMNGVSIIDLDPFNAANLALKYFKEQNQNKITVVSIEHPNKLIRANCFELAWNSTGGTCRLETRRNANDFENMEFESGKAYLFTSSWLLNYCSNIYQKKHGMELSEAATIIGIDGRNMFDPNSHKSVSIYPDWKEVGSRALSECLDRIKSPGRSPARIYLPCRLYDKIL